MIGNYHHVLREPTATAAAGDVVTMSSHLRYRSVRGKSTKRELRGSSVELIDNRFIELAHTADNGAVELSYTQVALSEQMFS
jgi:hypothetical protein